MILDGRERRLCHRLRDLPKESGYRYTETASRSLQRILFTSLAAENDEYLRILFKNNIPRVGQKWILRNAQGFIEGSEYSEAARGKACGHIFKNGDATYHCRTCTTDDTCVLCTRCFEASDHAGHIITHTVSSGNSGCCDCGDDEAWRIPVKCAIHTLEPSKAAGKDKQAPRLPEDLAEGIRMTIGRVIDYVCDVLSCSPENLRLEKQIELIKEDERESYLTSKWYQEAEDPDPEFALMLWNDEKHTVQDVSEQVARACRRELSFGLKKANDTNDLGRCVVKYSRDVNHLLQVANTIEQIKITVTIRSSRDTFREQMCDTIIEWLEDIAGCSVGDEHHILQQTVCEELLKSWRMGSSAINKEVGKNGLDDHEIDEAAESSQTVEDYGRQRGALTRFRRAHNMMELDFDNQDAPTTPDENDSGDDEADNQPNEDDVENERIILDHLIPVTQDTQDVIQGSGLLEDDLEVSEATYAGYPPPPPPPPVPPSQQARVMGPVRTLSGISDIGEPFANAEVAPRFFTFDIPKTPWLSRKKTQAYPPSYWLEQPEAVKSREPLPLHENLRQRVRLDWLMLFDLRLWKRVRIGLRDLYIKTVVSVSQFKRILGLRFAGLYTLLAQLFLIADREPDYAIINLSVQMLTTPSIVQENVERANFLTNLIAILYTFLTHRQVGHPWDVAIEQTLAFDAGSVANRRMYFFFGDLKRLFENAYVQGKLRTEERYQLQFLDLVRLPQGICPNIRAVGDHVEYENDVWIGASLMTKEMNRLCRQFADSFRSCNEEDNTRLMRVIRTVAKATVINSIGAERLRFDQAEIKSETKFKLVEPYLFETSAAGEKRHSIVNFAVESEPISFHHALHYTLSWLIDVGKEFPIDLMRSLLSFTDQDLKEPPPYQTLVPHHDPETYLIALFDFPLRVCAWLAQMKAGMWVRNGLSLRHQMSTYRGVSHRDFGHYRDIFLLQIGMVVCDPSRVLASMIDRFGMEDWMRGHFVIRAGFEPLQQLEMAEDLIHLLIVLLSDRTSLTPNESNNNDQAAALRRDITHILCFKPLSFSDLNSRLGLQDKPADMEVFMEILEEMANYKPPEGLSDSGLFELKPEFLADVDPYNAHYTKNQRDEAEHVYRSWMSKRLGKREEVIVLEPKLRPISSGIFTELSTFTKTPLFAQVMFYSLSYHLYPSISLEIPTTRIEAYLQVVLHLVLAAILEDDTDEDIEMEASHPLPSFVHNVLQKRSELGYTIFDLLAKVLENSEIRACHPKASLILHRIQERRPQTYNAIASSMISQGPGFPKLSLEKLGFESPQRPLAEDQATLESLAKELRKKQALDRQARVMAQFQQQQQNFLNNQDISDWAEDDADLDSMVTGNAEEHKKIWKYPSGNCILCQEETNDTRLFGTFGFMTSSSMFRQTDIRDTDFFDEVLSTPTSLDRTADDLRPFGVAGQNIKQVFKRSLDGKQITTDHQGLGRGFPPTHASRGPISVGCGHIMHYSCFELYCNSTERRQNHQIARNHPERLDRKEFVCPLCKALGNTFLPIVWKGKEEVFPGVLHPETIFDDWISSGIALTASRFFKREEARAGRIYQEQFVDYISKAIIPPLSSRFSSVLQAPLTSPTSPQTSSTGSGLGGLLLEDVFNPLTIPPQRNSAADVTLLDELISIYNRLRETIRTNGLASRFPGTSELPGKSIEDLGNSDTLAKILGNSIAATEIAQRGVQSEPGHLFIDKIPTSVMTHLRILSETASSYVAVGAMRNQGTSGPAYEFSEITRQQLLQLFSGNPRISGADAESVIALRLPSVMSQDPFVFLAECSVYLVPAFRLDIRHIIRLCYLLNIVKVSLHLMASPRIFERWSNLEGCASPESLRALSIFLSRIRLFSNPPWPISTFQDTAQSEPVAMYQSYRWLSPFHKAISAYALPFLRKCAILLNIRYGVDFPDTGFGDMDEPELERLTKSLHLPPLSEIFESAGGSLPGGLTIQESMIAGWIQHWQWHQSHQIMMRVIESRPKSNPEEILISSSYRSLMPEHPAIFELIGLPNQFDTLIFEATKRRCPTTGSRLEDPALCLFCGEIFCSQASCCHKGGKGGCNQHMQK